jgi:hypothetical protein
MENTIIAREHSFNNKGLKTANEDGLILHVYRGI